ARNAVNGGKAPAESAYAALPSMPAEAVRTRYQIRIEVADQPGVLAEVAALVARRGVAFETVRQGAHASADDVAELVIVTNEASKCALAATGVGLATIEVVNRITSILGMEGNWWPSRGAA